MIRNDNCRTRFKSSRDRFKKRETKTCGSLYYSIVLWWETIFSSSKISPRFKRGHIDSKSVDIPSVKIPK